MLEKKYSKAALLFCSLAAMAMILSACTSHPPLQKTMDYVDPDKFAGEWFVISNIPYFAERGKVASKTTYRRQGPNLFDDIFESKNGSFDKKLDKVTGTVKSINESNTRWQSTFYKVIKFKFDVINVDKDYQIILLGHPSRKYGWVMARTREISNQDYQYAMQRFKENDYDTSKFAKVPQLPEHIGQAGFQSTKQ